LVKVVHQAVGTASVVFVIGTDTGTVDFVLESLQYNLPATSLIIQSIPPSSPAPVTAEQDWIDHLCETIPGKSIPCREDQLGYVDKGGGRGTYIPYFLEGH
jgi:hypothetical protein